MITDRLKQTEISRRSFVKWSAVAGGAIAAAPRIDFASASSHIEALQQEAEIVGKLMRGCCPAHNCGGRCAVVATVKNGIITRIESDDRTYDEVDNPRILACSRGKSYRRRLYHPDRLKTPMKRVGERGEGKFEPISWEEAVDLAASEIQRVKETYGPSALFVPYGTGSYQQVNGSHIGQRLLNLYGGRLGYYNNYSWAQIQRATPTVYGTQTTGGERQDWVNSKYIIMWSWNPAEMIDGTNSAWFIKKAKENGAKVIVIDPRKSMSAVALADEWIPIVPGTDAALMSAMAYVMIDEDLYDKEFVATHCLGFDDSQMPAGLENEESYKDYILGTKDGVPKTPAWAEKITRIPRQKIVQIAREYATIKPAMLYQGYGMQRRAYGEQPVRAGCVLAAITGNVGISGGWASGIAFQPTPGPFWTAIPLGSNPVKTSIPCFLWSEAVLDGKGMTAEEGVRGAEKLDNDIKLIYAIATNCLVNQHSNINRSAEILKDTSKAEFIIVQDQFLTSTGMFADLLLPACMGYETYGIQDGWKYGNEAIFMPKMVEPAFESKSDYRIAAEIAEKLGIGDEFTEGRDERDWIEWIIENVYRANWFPEIPTIDEFEEQNLNVYSEPVTNPKIAFEEFRADPVANPLSTPSGLIEIFSPELYNMNKPDEIPAVPKYIQEWESPYGPEAEKYPLSALGHHYMHRVHSTHDNVDWLEEAFPQRVFINPLDAKKRGIADGDEVRIYNDRGVVQIPCRLSNKIMPGVVNIPTGGWWTPDENNVDKRGAVNVLSSERWSPLAFGNTQHTIMVEIERADAKGHEVTQ